MDAAQIEELLERLIDRQTETIEKLMNVYKRCEI
jgi:hypothetical protein